MWTYSVPDKRGVSGQKTDKVSCMTQQINRKFVIIWWEQWELTHCNSSLKPCCEPCHFLCGVFISGKVVLVASFSVQKLESSWLTLMNHPLVILDHFIS